MRFKLFYPKDRGFSILGIVVSAGVASGLAIVLTSITKDQQVSQKKTETFFEISNLSYLILRTLENGDACTQTLGTGTRIVNNTRWSSIKNRDGEVVLDKTNEYGNGLVKIQSLSPKNINIRGNTGNMNLQVTLEKLDTIDDENKKIIKMFPLSIDVDDSGGLVRCRSNRSNIVSTARERMCRVLDGVFDPVTEKCNLDHLLLDGQKQICENMEGVFDPGTPKCDMNPFVTKTVKAICKSVQGTFNDLTGKCLLISSSHYSDGEKLKFKSFYPICRIGFGVGITQGSKEQYGTSTFSTCFGPEVAKLFKTVKRDKDIKIRTAPWKSHWLQYDENGALNYINFYRRPRIPYENYRNQIYFIDNDPNKGLREMYRLVNVQIRMRYAKTGKWHTFAFAAGINYPNDATGNPDGWKQAEQALIDQGGQLLFDEKWLEPWKN